MSIKTNVIRIVELTYTPTVSLPDTSIPIVATIRAGELMNLGGLPAPAFPKSIVAGMTNESVQPVQPYVFTGVPNGYFLSDFNGVFAFLEAVKKIIDDEKKAVINAQAREKAEQEATVNVPRP